MDSDRMASPRISLALLAVFLLAAWAAPLCAQDNEELKKELQQLRDENRQLQNELQHQRELIEQLDNKFSGLQKTNAARENDYQTLKATVEGNTPPPPGNHGFSLGNVAITGEGAAGLYETGKNGRFPNAAFRVEEARLFFDAPVWEDIYFYGQVDLITLESYDTGLNLGELYLQFENLGKYWNKDQLLNARLGQFYIPFGEEYQSRFAIDNPLISHSLSDLWGYDAGVELFGSLHKFSYTVAAQNGGITTLNDNTADKSITARVGYDPAKWLHFSVSGFRTGELNASKDLSAIWIGGGLFKSIGSKATSLYDVTMGEFDSTAKWKRGYVKGAAGYAAYNDNDPAGQNHRDIYYYYVEALQHLTPKYYAAARFSQIRARNGYPIIGDMPGFGVRTSDLWRLSLGLGCNLNSHVALKIEYMMEHGQLSAGGPRNHENMIATEAAFKF
jgi:cell division protein FtsB